MIAGYIQTVRESKKKGTNIFSTLVLVVYCHRQYCSDCNVEFHSVEDRELHVGHATNLRYGDTYFSMGWGHLEARLQSCFVQVL